jgi:hypothetical protein
MNKEVEKALINALYNAKYDVESAAARLQIGEAIELCRQAYQETEPRYLQNKAFDKAASWLEEKGYEWGSEHGHLRTACFIRDAEGEVVFAGSKAEFTVFVKQLQEAL